MARNPKAPEVAENDEEDTPVGASGASASEAPEVVSAPAGPIVNASGSYKPATYPLSPGITRTDS